MTVAEFDSDRAVQAAARSAAPLIGVRVGDGTRACLRLTCLLCLARKLDGVVYNGARSDTNMTYSACILRP